MNVRVIEVPSMHPLAWIAYDTNGWVIENFAPSRHRVDRMR